MANNKTDILIHSEFSWTLSSLSFKTSLCGVANIRSDWKSQIVACPFARGYFIQSGHAFLHLENKTIKMTAGNIYIIPGDLPCGYSADDEMKKFFVHFSLIYHNAFDVFSGIKKIIILENKQNCIDNIINAYLSNNFSAPFVIKSHLYDIVAEAITKCGLTEEHFPSYSPIIIDAFKKISENIRFDYNSEELAKELKTSNVSFQRLFKKETGLTVNQYIKDKVLLSAALDLKRTNLSVREISEKYGFSDQFYFSRVFSKKYKTPPEKYRKNQL